MEHGVAGFIQPNDSINLLYTVKLSQAADLDSTAYLIPGLRVLAVGQTTTSTQTQQAQGSNGSTTATTQPPSQQQQGLITVEATPRQVEQIAHAMNYTGQMTLSLNPPGFNAKDFKSPQEIVETYNLFDQELTYAESVAAQLDKSK
jgi:Flp pilus assembly protein CpaB